jgi:pyruvate dehydrogenase E2 component (dihydrolipoamide acetyltransferase)
LSFKLPDIGEGIAEGEIVNWLVAEGAVVEEHQAVVEVMTDKATVEIPAPAAGVIQKFLAQAGDVVPIGSVIFELQTGAGAPAVAAPAPAAHAASATPAAPAARAATAAVSVTSGNGKVRAVPSARRVARELNVDLAQVPGSGRGGIVRRADVEAYYQSGATVQPASAAPAKPAFATLAIPIGDRETRTGFRGVRRKIAEAMARSKFTATHFTVVEELDVTDLIKVRAQAKEIGAKDGIKVTYMPFIMKAVASGLFRFPELNSQLDEATNEIVTYHYVNLGIAIDAAQGLIVPVIKDVQSKGVLQLASELSEIAERTRSGKIKPEELSGGTFTITNAGNIGGIFATPIINFPEVGILGVNRIMKRPGVVETPEGDSFEVRHYMNLSISVDHRLVDGASATRFLVYLRQVLENPGLLSL